MDYIVNLKELKQLVIKDFSLVPGYWIQFTFLDEENNFIDLSSNDCTIYMLAGTADDALAISKEKLISHPFF